MTLSLTMEPGIYFDITNEQYHASDGESASDVIAAGRSMLLYRYRKQHRSEPTPAMRLGTAVHCAILEPDLFDAKYVVMPEGMRRGTNAFKAFSAEHESKEPLTQREYDQIRLMRDAAHAHELSEYITMGAPEASVYATDPETGLLIKCRPDRLIAETGLCTNLKTCTDASERGFFSAISDYQYDWASAFYCDVLRLHYGRDFDEVHFLIEKDPPHHISVFSLSPEAVDFARAQYRQALRRIAKAKQTNTFPGYQAQLKVVTPPDWAQKKIEGDIV